MTITDADIKHGATFTNGSYTAASMRDSTGWRIDLKNGLVLVPWLKSQSDVAEYLNLGGHIQSAPFIKLEGGQA